MDESKILDMTYPFYQNTLRELGYRVQYEAISNLYGDSYVEKRSEIIEKCNPFLINIDEISDGISKHKHVTLGMLKSMGVIEK